MIPIARSHGRARAFTLIELLVTIAVILILVGVLITSVSAVRRQSLRTACGSNLRQLGQAILTYRSDHARMPVARNMPKPWQDNLYYEAPPIYKVLDSYLANDSKVYRCPADDGQIYDRCTRESPLGLGTSYEYQDWEQTLRFVPESGFDMARKQLAYDQIYEPDWKTPLKPSQHRGCNVLSNDGSVEFVPFAKTFGVKP